MAAITADKHERQSLQFNDIIPCNDCVFLPSPSGWLFFNLNGGQTQAFSGFQWVFYDISSVFCESQPVSAI
jgi:hypothetical protein